MSLDLSLTHPKCSTCNHEPESLDFNVTYNCSPMWYAIYPGASQLVDIDGMTGAEAEPIIRHAVEEMTRNKPRFSAMNPSNGWGSANGFRKFLTDIMVACIEHPTLVWSSCR